MKYKKSISRLDFLKKASIAVSGIGLLGSVPTTHGQSEISEKTEFRALGRTGIRVMPIGMGTTKTLNTNLIRTGYEEGVNFFDTARSYSDGQNEITLGKALKDVREKVIIQSKLKILQPERLNRSNSIPEVIRQMEQSVTESLKALQTDYVDLMLLQDMTDVNVIKHESVMSFLEGIKKRGLTRAIGFSCHSNMAELVRYNNDIQFYDTFMCAFNHQGAYTQSENGRYYSWNQEELIDELRIAKSNRIGFVAMKTVSGGPYQPSGQEKATYQAALKWVIQYDFVSTMAVAINNFQELEEDIHAIKV
jgi:aryl-alcohol dehydrogenase-like predicted oxidoreductase